MREGKDEGGRGRKRLEEVAGYVQRVKEKTITEKQKQKKTDEGWR